MIEKYLREDVKILGSHFVHPILLENLIWKNVILPADPSSLHQSFPWFVTSTQRCYPFVRWVQRKEMWIYYLLPLKILVLGEDNVKLLVN